MVSSSSERMIDFFEYGQHEDAAALANFEADFADRAVRVNNFVFAAGNDQDLVGADLHVAVGPDGQHGKEEKQNRPDTADHQTGRADFSEKKWSNHRFA